MNDGYGFGAEGDWKAAVLTRAAKVMAAGLPGGTSFMEDYTYHLPGNGEDLVLGAHMLEICPSIAAFRPNCEIYPLGNWWQARSCAAGIRYSPRCGSECNHSGPWQSISHGTQQNRSSSSASAAKNATCSKGCMETASLLRDCSRCLDLCRRIRPSYL